MEGSQHELEELLPLVTVNQATYLGLEDEIGTIDLGKWADIVIMDPDLKIKQTIVKGKQFMKVNYNSIKIHVVSDYESMSEKAASLLAAQVTLKNNSVLGLATGSTPEGMYAHLIGLFNNDQVDFSEVTTFNWTSTMPWIHPTSKVTRTI